MENEESYKVSVVKDKDIRFVSELPTRPAYRSISEEVAKVFGVKGKDNISYYPIYKKGKLSGYKLREHPKTFKSIGDCRGATELFGVSNHGKYLVITGGEEDAMAAYQMFLNHNPNYQYSVMSVVHGEQAVKDIANNIKDIQRYENVILCFDNDGKTKVEDMALLIGAKAKIMEIPQPYKDANDMLKAGQTKAFISAFFSAQAHKPAGILSAEELFEEVFEPEPHSHIRYAYDKLDKMTMGIRTGELVTFTAGTGCGKTTFIHNTVGHILTTTEERVGILALEEKPSRTLRNLCRNLHITKEEDYKALYHDGRVLLYDSFGCTEIQDVLNTIRYMVVSGCKVIILDHVSMLVTNVQDDERRALDRIMVQLRTLVQELDFALLMVSHLRRAQGDQGYEDGKQVTLSGLRSSSSIGQLSDCVIALERTLSGDDAEERNTVKVRVLKNRYTGDTGLVGELVYDKENHSLVPIDVTKGEF
jgi:twinkle protein